MGTRWNFSLGMLVAYVSLFIVWMLFPSRPLFLLTGLLTAGFLCWGLVRAHRMQYFANLIDLRLHALVIIDIVLETLSFELFRLFEPMAVVESFHRNTNFVGCTLAFTVLLGCYRFYASRKSVTLPSPSPATPQL